MTKYHISSDGNPRRCSAAPEKCPFGADTPHFANVADARANYEKNIASAVSRPVRKAKVYRVGTLTPREPHFEDLKNILQDMDKHKPEGRQGRSGGIFASPDLASHSRWVRGSQWNKHEGALDSHEMTVDANTVYVYSVEDYETASAKQSMYGGDSPEFTEAAKAYWDNGMTLTEWNSWAEEHKPERGSWEIVMPPAAIITARKMSNRAVIENSSEDDAQELNRILEPVRYRKGLIWRKKTQQSEEDA